MNTNRKIDLTCGAIVATVLILWALTFCLTGCGEIPDVYTEPVEDTATAQDAPIFTADYIAYETAETAPENPGLNFRPRKPVPHPGNPNSPNLDPNQVDWDGDGFLPVDGDCNNFDPEIGPGFFDYCDNLNNDCDDEIDEGVAEEHIFCAKNFNGVPTQGLLWCVHWAEDDITVAEVVCELDCQWEEVCDNVDNDCDGIVDEDLICTNPECTSDDDCVPFITECIDSICMGPDDGCFTYLRDDDGDGWSRCGIDGREPPDCNENNPLVNPGTAEICDDDLDNDCDAAIDEDDCVSLPTECSTNQECDERYGDDCLVYACRTDGYCTYSHYRDDDGDGHLKCGGVLSDCNDSDPAIYPGAPEVCHDGVDNDCDGEVDEGCTPIPPECAADGDCSVHNSECLIFRCVATRCFAYERDDDGDGYSLCGGLPEGQHYDCNDSDPAIYPGAPEICDRLDNDCDGMVDEDCFCDHTLTFFSDSETITATGSLAVPTWNENSRWTASIPGATWIWDEYLETSPQIDSTVRFARHITLPADAMAISGTLLMSADNSFYAWLNGGIVGDSQIETNYFHVSEFALTPFLAPGTNSLTWEVKNWAQHHGTAYTNPGGLLYRVDLSYLSAEGCDIPIARNVL